MAEPIAPPRIAPPMYGLLLAAARPEQEGDAWERGIAFTPDACTGGGVADPCGNDLRDDPARGEKQDYTPFLVHDGVACTANGWDRDPWDRAARLLAARESYHVEREFWTGALATAAGWPNRFLAEAGASDDVTPAGGAVALNDAVGILEEALADCSHGQRGMIHVPARLASADPLSVRRDGRLWLTRLDNILVPGAGYPGTGPGGAAPAAGEAWVYATGTVEVRLGDVEHLPPRPVREDGEGDAEYAGRLFAAATDFARNNTTVWVQRAASATWDGCCHLAIRVTV